MSAPKMTRLDELQADDAIWGVDEAAQQELAEALRGADLERDDSWERSAAVATVALQEGLPSGPSQQLLNALRAAAPLPQLEESAIRHWLQPNMVLAAACIVAQATADDEGPLPVSVQPVSAQPIGKRRMGFHVRPRHALAIQRGARIQRLKPICRLVFTN